jgi:hypothetical protein
MSYLPASQKITQGKNTRSQDAPYQVLFLPIPTCAMLGKPHSHLAMKLAIYTLRTSDLLKLQVFKLRVDTFLISKNLKNTSYTFIT